MTDKWVLIFLGIFLLLFGIFAVTNIDIAWGKYIMGFSALIAGAVCLFRALK